MIGLAMLPDERRGKLDHEGAGHSSSWRLHPSYKPFCTSSNTSSAYTVIPLAEAPCFSAPQNISNLHPFSLILSPMACSGLNLERVLYLKEFQHLERKAPLDPHFQRENKQLNII